MHHRIEWWLGLVSSKPLLCDFVSLYSCIFLLPLTWGHVLEAVLLALGESVLLPLTWGKLIPGISSEGFPKILVAELALPKPGKAGAKAPWTGVPLPPGPTRRDVACLYLWICLLEFFSFEQQVSLCGSLCSYLSSVLACGELWLFWSEILVGTMAHCHTAGYQHWWSSGVCKTKPCAAFLTPSCLPFTCVVLVTIFIGSNVLIGLNAFVHALASHLL